MHASCLRLHGKSRHLVLSCFATCPWRILQCGKVAATNSLPKCSGNIGTREGCTSVSVCASVFARVWQTVLVISHAFCSCREPVSFSFHPHTCTCFQVGDAHLMQAHRVPVDEEHMQWKMVIVLQNDGHMAHISKLFVRAQIGTCNAMTGVQCAAVPLQCHDKSTET